MIEAHIYRYTKGVTLIETLVALLVLSIGLLGVATLHLQASKATHSSYYRSLATLIAADAEERVWMHLGKNKTVTDSNLTEIENEWRTSWQNSCPNGSDCQAILPDPQLTLSSPSGTGATWLDVDIEVSWRESRFDEPGLDGPDARESFGYRMRVLQGDPDA